MNLFVFGLIIIGVFSNWLSLNSANLINLIDLSIWVDLSVWIDLTDLIDNFDFVMKLLIELLLMSLMLFLNLLEHTHLQHLSFLINSVLSGFDLILPLLELFHLGWDPVYFLAQFTFELSQIQWFLLNDLLHSDDLLIGNLLLDFSLYELMQI